MRHSGLNVDERNELATVVLTKLGDLFEATDQFPMDLDVGNAQQQIRIWASYIPTPVRDLRLEPEYADQNVKAITDRDAKVAARKAAAAEKAAAEQAKVDEKARKAAEKATADQAKADEKARKEAEKEAAKNKVEPTPEPTPEPAKGQGRATDKARKEAKNNERTPEPANA